MPAWNCILFFIVSLLRDLNIPKCWEEISVETLQFKVVLNGGITVDYTLYKS